MPIPKFDEMTLPILKRLEQEPEGELLTSKNFRKFVIGHYSRSYEVKQIDSDYFEE